MILVDTNVLIDILERKPLFYAASLQAISVARLAGDIAINDVVFAEASVTFRDAADAHRAVSALGVVRMPMSDEALHLAGRIFLDYRRRGGVRTGVLPDFFIGAQAQSEGWPLLTRDGRRYRSYFPDLELIAP